jgi:hypothetical protein
MLVGASVRGRRDSAETHTNDANDDQRHSEQLARGEVLAEQVPTEGRRHHRFDTEADGVRGRQPGELDGAGEQDGSEHEQATTARLGHTRVKPSDAFMKAPPTANAPEAASTNLTLRGGAGRAA